MVAKQGLPVFSWFVYTFLLFDMEVAMCEEALGIQDCLKDICDKT